MLQRYEKGRVPRGDILDRLALVFGVTTRWLLNGSDAQVKIVAETPAPYGKKEKRLMDEIDKLLESGDEVVFQHLKRQVDLLQDAVAHRREKGKA